MMQYDVIENNGVLAPSRREAIIDPGSSNEVFS